MVRSDNEVQTDENSDVENCENCLSIKSLTEEGRVLQELKRIRNQQTKLPVKNEKNYRRSRPPSAEAYSDELMAFQEPDDAVRVLVTPMGKLGLFTYKAHSYFILDGRRPPRPSSIDSQTQTEHTCPESPCHSPIKSIRVSFCFQVFSITNSL